MNFTRAFFSVYNGALNRSTQHIILDGGIERVAMYLGYRRDFTAAEKTKLWDRWQRGDSLNAFGRAFGKPLFQKIPLRWLQQKVSVWERELATRTDTMEWLCNALEKTGCFST